MRCASERHQKTPSFFFFLQISWRRLLWPWRFDRLGLVRACAGIDVAGA